MHFLENFLLLAWSGTRAASRLAPFLGLDLTGVLRKPFRGQGYVDLSPKRATHPTFGEKQKPNRYPKIREFSQKAKDVEGPEGSSHKKPKSAPVCAASASASDTSDRTWDTWRRVAESPKRAPPKEPTRTCANYVRTLELSRQCGSMRITLVLSNQIGLCGGSGRDHVVRPGSCTIAFWPLFSAIEVSVFAF